MKKLQIVRIGWLTCLLAVIVSFLWADRADAHHPEIQASAVCSDSGLALVTVIAEAWANPEPIRRINHQVSIDYFDNGLNKGWVNVALGSFGASNNFTISTIANVALSQGSVLFRATSVANWGPNGEFGSAGEYRETTVQLPTGCGTPPVITPPPVTPPVTTPPVVTLAPTSTTTTTRATTTTTRPPEGRVIVQPPTKLADTDRENLPVLSIIAGCLILVGIALVIAKPGKRV